MSENLSPLACHFVRNTTYSTNFSDDCKVTLHNLLTGQRLFLSINATDEETAGVAKVYVSVNAKEEKGMA
ncbi:hypothetical protein N007_08030 [Alicyclobacillus acidoterrestris ATCC 49025]|nr:hypothetical protein N007_08030 [Alicyclobacillus acidoterrestris ATCC 49025]